VIPVYVVVSTCPRPRGANYLAGTLERLDAAGAHGLDRMVLSDGPLEGACDWPNIERVPARRSTRENLWQAFRLALEVQAERLLYFEDDLWPCRNAVARMVAVPVPEGTALVSYHDKRWRSLGRTAVGVHVVPAPDVDGKGFWGSQALSIPRRALEYLATRDPYAIRTANTARNCDRVLEDYVAVSPWPRIAYHAPSLIRHVGEVSVAHPDRTNPPTHIPWNYAGDDFDALSLGPAEIIRHGAA